MYTYDDLLLFAKIIDCGSFVATAKLLNITQSTVSRRIKLLEESLGCNLFQYDGKKATPTDIGQQIYSKLKSYNGVFYELETFVDKVIQQNNNTPIGDLRVVLQATAFTNFTQYLSLFNKKYPDITLNLLYSDYPSGFDIMKDDIDLMVSHTPPTRDSESNCKITNLMSYDVGLYCTTEYIAKYGEPTSIEDLDNHKIIGYLGNSFTKLKLVEFKHQQTHEIIIREMKFPIYINANLNVTEFCKSNEFIVGIRSINATVNNLSVIRILPEYSVNDTLMPVNNLYLIKNPFKENVANRLLANFITTIFKLEKEGYTDKAIKLREYLGL